MRCRRVLLGVVGLAAAGGCASVTGLADYVVTGDPVASAAEDGGGKGDRGPEPVATDAGDAPEPPLPILDATPPDPPPPPDTEPDVFTFDDVGNAALGTVFTESTEVTGFDGTLVASVSGGAQIRANAGSFGPTASVVSGDTLEIRMTSSSSPGASVTATVTLGTVTSDWTISSLPNCPATTVSWNVSGTACAAASAALAPGAKRTITDSVLNPTGSATVTCSNGKLVTSATTCEVPRAINVNTTTGCVKGYCTAAVGGQCGKADPAKATAICKAKGFLKHTTYATSLGPIAPQCLATGTGCFVNGNPSCNIIFTSVTCQH